MSPLNRLHRIEQNEATSSKTEQLSLKQREPVKLIGSAEKAKQETRDHHQSHYSSSPLALFETELKLA